MLYQEFCNNHSSNYEAHKENKKKSMDKGMLESLGAYKAKIYLNVNFNTTEVERGVPSSHKCIIVEYGGFIGTKYHM
jgi:hypothetical protein